VYAGDGWRSGHRLHWRGSRAARASVTAALPAAALAARSRASGAAGLTLLRRGRWCCVWLGGAAGARTGART
jgi:hypothetical protein